MAYAKCCYTDEHPLLKQPPFSYVDKWAAEVPEKEAYVFRASEKERDVITYGELKQATEYLSVWFRRQFNLVKGERVGILSVNRPTYVLCDLALARIGAVSVRLYATMDSKLELTRSLKLNDCRLLLCQPDSLPSVREILPMLDTHGSGPLKSAELPRLEHVVVMCGEEEHPGTTLLPRYTSISASEEELTTLRGIQSTISMDDDCTVYSTSGSTGIPKYVVLSYGAAMNAMIQIVSRCGISYEDKYLNDRPLAHSAGSTFICLPFGATEIIANPWKTVADADSYLGRVVVEEKVTCGFMLPYILYDLVTTCPNAADIAQRHLKFITFGGQLTNAETLRAVKSALNAPLIQAYGSTETAGICATLPSDEVGTVATSVGAVLPGVEVKIVDLDTREILPRGEIGTVAIRKQHKWRYLSEQKMRELRDGEGYFYPGDMARMEMDGYVQVVGRKDDMLSVGTVKVYPSPIEMKICQHPSVNKAIVFGVPDARLHEVIGAAVLAEPGHQLTSQQILDFFQASVGQADLMTGTMMGPKHVWVRRSFPVTASGKVDKMKLRQICLDQL